MTTVSIEEFMHSSWLGKYLEIVTDTGKRIQGQINGINAQTLSILESHTMAQVILEVSHVTAINLGSGTEIDKQYAIKFKNRHSHMADNADLTFAGQFSERLRKYASNCSSEEIQLYINSELNRNAASNLPQMLRKLYSQMDRFPLDSDSRVIRLMILYRLRKFAACAGILHEILVDPDEPTPELICACFFAQCKNGISAYFWLTQHLLRMEDKKLYDTYIWWYYLKGCVTYSSYEFLEKLINKAGGFDTALGIESMAYLHALNNNTLRSIQLMDALNNDKYSTFYKSSDYGLWMLAVDPDNHYHRYLRAIARIIQNNELNNFEDTNLITGYIYEYIPDKGYGFIIGTDLLSYFFNRDDIAANSVMDEIKNNICAFLSVAEEKLVKVSFTRTEQSKRTYSAYNIF